MPYGLPPAWNPGFAVPDNVLDEGLERRAFVTRQMPRGTYDQFPEDPTGGYVVPQYIRDEGYGQGAVVTKWMPRGEYGPRVPQWIQRQPTVAKMTGGKGQAHTVTMQRRAFGRPKYAGMSTGQNYGSQFSGLGGLSGDPPLPGPFEQFGQRAAQEIISRVSQIAPGSRKQQLRAIMDRIDPSLWNRTAEITRRYVGQGLSAGEAFSRGLSRALAAGLAADMIATGRSGRAPQANSLLGLGCFGPCMGLGATTAPTVMSVSSVLTALTGPTPIGGTTTTLRFGVDLPGGPLLIASRIGASIRVTPTNGALNPARYDDIYARLASATDAMIKAVAQSPTIVGVSLGKLLNINSMVPSDRLFGTTLPRRNFLADFVNGRWPIYKASDHPAAYANLGLVVKNVGSAASPSFDLVLAKFDPGMLSNFGEGIKTLVVDAVDSVGDAVHAIGNLACGVASNPNVVQAGAMAGAAAGGGPSGAAAGAAGAAIAQNLCGGPKIPLPPPMPPPKDDLLPVVLIGGGVLAAAILLTRKKRSP